MKRTKCGHTHTCVVLGLMLFYRDFIEMCTSEKAIVQEQITLSLVTENVFNHSVHPHKASWWSDQAEENEMARILRHEEHSCTSACKVLSESLSVTPCNDETSYVYVRMSR